MKTYSFDYDRVRRAELSIADRELCDRAVAATQGSYSPYSHYKVGAALRLGNGEIILGANQENASYPCGTCAERTALNYAQAAYPHEPVNSIAIAAEQGNGNDTTTPFPCGLCRQSLAEVEQRQGSPIRVLAVGGEEVFVFPSASCLLPFAFAQP
ncbi:MAG: cytidine deaminase [Prevotellaceae bacterium]|nr:cytidine deaminase [Prevotellaceae bacterium]